jgi:hypothetical protein
MKYKLRLTVMLVVLTGKMSMGQVLCDVQLSGYSRRLKDRFV